MKPEKKELLRISILTLMDANRTRFGLGKAAIALHLQSFGYTAANCGGQENFQDEIADAIGYLESKGLAEEMLKQVSPENRAWRITQAGIAYIDERV